MISPMNQRLMEVKMSLLQPFDPSAVATLPEQKQRRRDTRIRLRIPKQYHQEPIISDLITQYHLTVNIGAALLGAGQRDDGWFDLNLQGTGDQIYSALIHLNDLGVEIWQDTEDQGC
jgi:ABC-type methionine transport system ATPase subunit